MLGALKTKENQKEKENQPKRRYKIQPSLSGFLRCPAMFMPTRVLCSVVFKLARIPHNMPMSHSICLTVTNHDALVWSQRGYASDSYRQKQPINEEHLGMDDVDAHIEAVIREEKNKMQTIKFHKIHRQLRPKGAPERKLTWMAIEQIRFLKRESPEEWTIQRLAEGFSVTPDEISRILRSKFSPSLERKLKQDRIVMAKHQQQSLADKTNVRPRLLPRSSPQATLPSGTTVALAVAQPSQRMTKVDSKEITCFSKSSTALSPGSSELLSTQSTTHVITVPSHNKDDTVISEKSVEIEEDEEDYPEDEEVWDGVTFSDAELQDFAQIVTDKHTPVVQKGREYFDTKGNFLYRV